MSLKRMLQEKTDHIVEASRAEARAPDQGRQRPVTAPGALFGLRQEMTKNEERVAELESVLGRYQGALPTRKLDPKRVRMSRWANRHPATFTEPEFVALKAEISSAGGNVQPIKVRPISGEDSADYEIVYGHRRHRACEELGLEVLAVIEAMDDQALVAEMDRENRSREDLRPYESAMEYRRALDAKLWPSQVQLAAALGVTQAYVSQVLAIAELPKYVIEAFRSPLEIQVRWGVALTQRLKTDQQSVKAAAARLRSSEGSHTARDVFAMLMDQRVKARTSELKVGGQRMGTLKVQGDRVLVQFERGVIPTEKLAPLERVLKEFLQGKTLVKR